MVSYWFRAAVRRRVKRGGRRGVVLLQVYVRLVHSDDALVGKPVGLFHMPHRHLLAAVQPGGADGRGEGGPAGGGVGQAAGKRRPVVVGMLAVVT